MIKNTTLESNYSTDSPTHAQYAERSTEEGAILAFIIGLIGIIAFVGNVIVIACVRVHRRLREEVGSYFIINLCLADMTTSIIVMSSSLHSVLSGVWTVHKPYCQFVCCINYTLIIVSMLTLSFIAVDRFMAVVYALRYHALMKKKVATLLISWSWLQGLCFGMVPAVEDWIHYDYGEIVCAIRWVGRDPLIYVIVAFTLCFFIPGGILGILYCKVMSVVQSQLQSNNVHLGSLTQDGNNRTHPRGATLSHKPHSLTNNVPLEVQQLRNDDLCVDHDLGINRKRHSLENLSRKPGMNLSSIEQNCHLLNAQAVENRHDYADTNSLSTSPLKTKGKSYNRSESFNGPDQECPEGNLISSSPELQKLPKSPLPTPLMYSTKRHSKSLPVIKISPSVAHAVSYKCHSQTAREISRQRRLSPSAIDVHTGNEEEEEPSHVGNCMAVSQIPTHNDKEMNPARVSYSASRKALRSLLVVVVAFFICMTPFSVTKLYKVILSDSHALPGYVNVVSTIAQYCSSAINPLIYGVLRKDFQKAFKILLKKIRKSTDNYVYTS